MQQSPSLLRRLDGTGVPLLLARLLIGGFFIYMGIVKIQDPVAFLKQVRLYEMLPESPPHLLNGTAILLPWLEVVCGLALVLGVYLRGAGTIIALMLVVFTPAIFLRAWGIHSTEGTPFLEIAFDCGCGTGAVIIWQKLLGNTGLLLGALVAVFSASRRFCLPSGRRPSDAEQAPSPAAEAS